MGSPELLMGSSGAMHHPLDSCGRFFYTSEWLAEHVDINTGDCELVKEELVLKKVTFNMVN